MEVKGLEAGTSHTAHGHRVLHVHQINAEIRLPLKKVVATCGGESTKELFSNGRLNFPSQICTVSNLSRVTVQQQGQHADFWNVPCELHSM